MKINELRELSNNELTQKLEDLREEMFNLRFHKASNRLENNQRVGKVRRTVARIHTILTQRSGNQEVNNGK